MPVQVGISSVWYEGNTCNMHLNDLAAEVRLRHPLSFNGIICMAFAQTA